MIWAEIFAAIKLFMAVLPSEVNMLAVESTAWAVYQAGWTKGAFLTAVIADAFDIFPNAVTRPWAVAVLQALLDLENLTTKL